MKNLITIISTFFLFSILVQGQRLFPLFPENENYFFLDTGDEDIESNSFNQTSNVAVEFNGDLIIGGTFTSYNDQTMEKLAVWNGEEMTPFPASLPGITKVHDMLVFEGELIISGSGTNTIQRYNGSYWENITYSFFDQVYSMQVINDVLYAVGSTSTGFQLGKLIDGEWTNLGGELNGEIFDIEYFEEEIYVCGSFTEDDNGNALFGISKLVGNQLIQVYNGLNETVYSMALFQDDLILCGSFDLDGNEVESIRRLARFDGESLFEMEEYNFLTEDTKFVNLIRIDNDLIASPSSSRNYLGSGLKRKLILREGEDYFDPFLEEYTGSGSLQNQISIYDLINYNDDYILLGDMEGNYQTARFSNIARYEAGTPTMESISNGSMSMDMFAGGRLFHHNLMNETTMQIPINSGLSTNYSSGLYISAKSDNEIYYAHESYYGATLQFGPKAEVYNLEYLKKYSRLWKITKDQNDYHASNYASMGYTAPEAILNWPAHGNLSNGESEDLAPFIDINSNGVYEPTLGDYPEIRGDECIYYLLSDHRKSYILEENNLDLEIGVMLYLYYDADEIIENTVFVHYEIKNVSNTDYEEFSIGMWSDMDIGTSSDDYVGCDSELSYFYGYNGDTNDEPSSSSGGYGLDPPAHGILLLNRSMDGAIYYHNSSSPGTGDPQTPEEFHNYLNNKWRDGTPLTSYGTGYNPSDTVNITNYMFDNYPWTSGWCEQNEENGPGDRRMVSNHHIGDFQQEEQLCFDVAFTTSFGPEGGGPEGSLLKLSQDISLVQAFYNSSDEACDYFTNSINEAELSDSGFAFFPNPASENLTLVSEQQITELVVFNSAGQMVIQEQNLVKKQIDIRDLSPGIYLVTTTIEGRLESRKLIIE